MKPSLAATFAILFLAAAAPAAAQNSSAEPPAVAAPPPKTEPAPPASTAPPTPAPEPAPVIVQPSPQPAPIQPVTIQPDQAYPNGFQDPANPFANEMLAYREEQEGFPWGLLGLLGLLGLVPLFRGNGNVRTVYVERDEPRRVVRREDRIDEDR
jgi:hypothetical protein